MRWDPRGVPTGEVLGVPSKSRTVVGLFVVYVEGATCSLTPCCHAPGYHVDVALVHQADVRDSLAARGRGVEVRSYPHPQAAGHLQPYGP